MSIHFKIKDDLTVSQLDKTIYLSTEQSITMLSEPVHVDIILFLLSSSQTIEAVLECLSHCHPTVYIHRSIKTLLSKNILQLIENNSSFIISDNVRTRIDRQIKRNKNSNNFNTQHTVKLTELNGHLFSPYMQENQVSKSMQETLSVVVTNDYLDCKIKTINQHHLDAGTPWMLVKPFGSKIIVGPTFSDVNQTCWECLRQKMRLHQPFMQLRDNSHTILKQPQPNYTSESLSIAAKVLSDELSDLNLNSKEASLITLDLVTGEKIRHKLISRPQCSVCGMSHQKTKYEDLPIFTNNSEISNIAGGYRSVTAEATFQKYQHLISPITGIMSKVTSYHHQHNAPIFNYSSGRNLALQSKNMFWLNNHMRSCSGGKGKNKQQAQTGALCEAIERYSLVHHGQTPCITKSYSDLGSKAIHPNKCMNFSEQQFEGREKINQQCSSFYSLIPIPFNENEKIEWTSVYSLMTKNIHYLPSAYCYAQYPHKDETRLIAYPDSNGCAAGNTYAEAILQASLELIERDAAAIWWYNRIQRPRVELDVLNNRYINSVSEYYHSIGRSLYVLDITTDIVVPTFVAVSYLESTGKEILYGFGCHVDASIAVERAIIEINQLLPIVINSRADKLGAQLNNWLDQQAIKDNLYLMPSEEQAIDINTVYQSVPNPSLSTAINDLVSKFSDLKIDLLMLDLTQPDIGMPVVKVVAPGLRHFWRRLGAGRLYDTPVKMGWLTSANKEQELNQHSIVI